MHQHTQSVLQLVRLEQPAQTAGSCSRWGAVGPGRMGPQNASGALTQAATGRGGKHPAGEETSSDGICEQTLLAYAAAACAWQGDTGGEHRKLEKPH